MKYQLVEVSNILLDRNNPRIKAHLEYYEEINDENIGLALDATNSFEVLRESIRTSKGIINPIILKKEGDKYLVIEGNTRVFIYREFKEENIVGNWDYIPAIVYDSMEKTDIDKIRLQAHLVGPREWDPYSKAKYIHSLYIENLMSVDKIISLCGGKKREIWDYINAYKMMETSYKSQLEHEYMFEKNKFSAFVEFQKGSIKKAVREKGYTEDDFSKWVIQEKFTPLNTIRKLPHILNDKKALEVFLSKGGTAGDAIKCIETPVPEKIDIENLSIDDLINALLIKFKSVSWEYNREIINNPNSDVYRGINELIKQLTSFLSLESDKNYE